VKEDNEAIIQRIFDGFLMTKLLKRNLYGMNATSGMHSALSHHLLH